jgi:two-component system cell cycle sensor histidine kinase PleC
MSAANALQQAVVAIRPIAEKEGVHLSFTNDLNTPAIEGDVAKLRQALTGILHNAVKFTPAGGEVRISLNRAGANIAIRIEDDGVGMSKADVELVTRPFHRLRSALDGQDQGAGLGLPFAKAIIELHNGALVIKSAPGSGTAVEIRLPATDAKMSDAA